MGIFETFQELSSVFDVGFIIIDFRVENVAQSYFPQKQVANPPHAVRIAVLRPYFAKPSYCGEGAFEFGEVFSDSLVGSGALLADLPKNFAIIVDKSNYCFAIVLCNIFCLVARTSFC